MIMSSSGSSDESGESESSNGIIHRFHLMMKIIMMKAMTMI